MTKKQRDEIKKNVHAVSDMDYGKLCLFVQQLFMSKVDMDAVVFEYTIRACDIQAANHRDVTSLSPMIVIGDLREGEI